MTHEQKFMDLCASVGWPMRYLGGEYNEIIVDDGIGPFFQSVW